MASPDIFDKISELQASQREIAVLQKIHTDSLDKLTKILEEQKEILSNNTAIVKEHERRSLSLEGRQAVLEQEMEPIKRHLSELAGMGKFLKFFGAIATVIATLLTISQFLRR